MKESVTQPTNGSRCRGHNRAGLPCRKAAVTVGGFCLSHDPERPQDMAALGRKGGSVRPTTKLRANVDEDLREQARETLSRALAGEDVPKPALDAARSLFAYRPSEAPRGAERDEPAHPGRGCFYIGDLIRVAVELGVLECEGEVRIGGEVVAATHTATPPKAKARATVSGDSSARENPKPETAPAPPDFPAGADFDESQEAVLDRRHGGTGEWSHV